MSLTFWAPLSFFSTGVCPSQTDWFLPFSGTRWQFSKMGFLFLPIPRNRFPWSRPPQSISELLKGNLGLLLRQFSKMPIPRNRFLRSRPHSVFLCFFIINNHKSCNCTITLATFQIAMHWWKCDIFPRSVSLPDSFSSRFPEIDFVDQYSGLSSRGS